MGAGMPALGLLERPTVHKGVVARAMEKKGIISNRCELNRQIKADNALLRELRGQVKKLAQAVKNTIPALADAMENLRKNLLLFCYQLGYLCKGKERLNASLNTLRPALTQYNQLAKDIRDKTKERRSLLTEKKALSAVHVFRHRELAAEGITTRDGCRWMDSNIKVVLTNVTYTGNLLLQKEFIADPITKQKKKNRGELPQYYVEDTHPSIIDKATFDFVQEEMARRRELGPLANKSLNTSCFTGKIKCPYCGQSYMHNRRVKNGNIQEYWNCGSKKKKGAGCPVGGTINHKNMVKVCTEVLGLDEFDEAIFLEKVDHIDVPERYTLEFHMADGRVVTKACPNTGHQDCWTPERRTEVSARRRENGTNPIGASCFTGQIKCVSCGCNFRKATRNCKDGSKVSHWRCAEHNGCDAPSLREDLLEQMVAEVLGLDAFDAAAFREQIDRVEVLSSSELRFYFKAGRTASREWQPPERVSRPWTDEQRAKFKKSIKGTYTPERRQQISEHMKQLRKERGDKWRKEK